MNWPKGLLSRCKCHCGVRLNALSSTYVPVFHLELLTQGSPACPSPARVPFCKQDLFTDGSSFYCAPSKHTVIKEQRNHTGSIRRLSWPEELTSLCQAEMTVRKDNR